MNGRHNDPGNRLLTKVTALERGTPPDGGRAGAGLVFLGGLAFVGGFGWLLLDAWRNAVLSPPFAFVSALGVLVGLTALYWRWRPLMLMCRTALPCAVISPSELGVGSEFSFSYWQRVWLPLRADVTTSLVLRETITGQTEDGAATRRKRDHLVSAHTEKGLRIRAGGFLRMRGIFRLPAEPRDFPVVNWPVQPMVKVHVQVRRGADYWEEFVLPLPGAMTSPTSNAEVVETGYQVTLLSFPNLYRGLPPPPPLDEYLPHLVQVDRLPVVVLRGITRTKAEVVCRRLEAAGGVVEMGQGGRVVEYQRMSDLPLPAETAGPDAHTLPVPAETTRLEPRKLPLPTSKTDGSIRSTSSRRTDESGVNKSIQQR